MTARRLRVLAVASSLTAAAAVSAAAPASAAFYSYSIAGNFANNTGPNQKGTFSGVARWDTSLNGGSGGWYQWSFEFFNSGGTQLLALNHTDTGAGCFASPLAKGTAASGTYASSAPGGSVCVGDNDPADPAPTYAPQTFLNIFSQIPYNLGSNPTTYSYFRLKFVPNADPTLLQAVEANAQSVAGLGWAAMTAAPGSPTCTAKGSFPTDPGNCPYAGNTQNYQGISGVTKVAVTNTYYNETIPDPANIDPPPAPPNTETVPGPLPLLGASAAFGWSRHLRRRLGRRAGA